ncbi:hypothetical protein Y032_0011g1396 [Ancylostoma ceylanicum]|uniref:Uncharacterized protein n=1 Tax=Ancylostoma ceylanicum TaxID=53326 RepID=A0A016VGB5_9BILA|nr:hypothetical protein Y032_0011g1396 [Ancylostoma ceylanicum]
MTALRKKKCAEDKNAEQRAAALRYAHCESESVAGIMRSNAKLRRRPLEFLLKLVDLALFAVDKVVVERFRQPCVHGWILPATNTITEEQVTAGAFRTVLFRTAKELTLEKCVLDV